MAIFYGSAGYAKKMPPIAANNYFCAEIKSPVYLRPAMIKAFFTRNHSCLT